MRIVFLYKNIILGGCEILIYRLSKELMDKCDISIVCNSIDTSMQNNFRKDSINCEIENDWNLNRITKKYWKENTKYITFFVDDFLNVWNVNEYGKNSFLYVVNPKIFDFTNNRLKKIIINNALKNFIKERIASYNIFFMDEQCIDNACMYLGLSKSVNNFAKIIRISCDKNDIVSRRVKIPNRISILSIARAEFPFKGYILGLMNWFEKECSSDNRFYLTIVTYGENEDEVMKLYSQFDEDLKRRIEIVGKTESEELTKIIDQTAFYIGMGTTIINASQRGVISFPVATFTYDLLVKDVFCNIPNCIAIEGGDCGYVKNLRELLVDIYENEYHEISERHIETIKDMYSPDANANRLNDLVRDVSMDRLDKLVKIYCMAKALKCRK